MGEAFFWRCEDDQRRIGNCGCQLTIGRDYDVLEMSFYPQQGTELRMIGNEPYTPALFSGDLFDVIDSRIPRNWVVVKDKNGVYRFSPAAWLEAGFCERFVDGDPSAVATFTEQQRLAKES